MMLIKLPGRRALARAVLWVARRWIVERRAPDEVLHTNGDVYMRRWFLTPKSRRGGLYLHCQLRSDVDQEFHDHPWWNMSLVLAGGYFEHTPGLRGFKPLRQPGDIVARGALEPHRLLLPSGARCSWSLFLVGPNKRDWGFLGWVPWREHVESRGDTPL